MVRDAQDLSALMRSDEVGVSIEAPIVGVCSRDYPAGSTAGLFGSGSRFRGIGLGRSQGLG